MNFATGVSEPRSFRKSMIKVLNSCGDLIEYITEPGANADIPDLVLSVGGDGTSWKQYLRLRIWGYPVAGVNTREHGLPCQYSF